VAAEDRDGRPVDRGRFIRRALIFIAIGLGASAFAAASFFRTPFGGEPIVIAQIPPQAQMAKEEVAAGVPIRQGLKPEDTPITSNGQPVSSVVEIDPDDIEIIDPTTLAIPDLPIEGPQESGNIRLARAPIDGFSEKGEFGQLPKISSGGRKPSMIYARPYQQTDARDAPVRIAIMITGVGISSSGTREAIERLPGEVTLAFAPYGDGLQTWVNRARAGGHEVMLQVPMEPFDYPDNDPGPHTLLTGTKTAENINRLNWLLSRFGGYFGITNYMGAKFTADDTALVPIMAELAARGLSFLDDGGSPRSRAVPVAVAKDIAAKSADVIIDAGQSRETIEEALRRLESVAKERGSAIGVGTALPITVKIISEWAKSLSSRGISLAPVSALLNPAEG